MRVEVVRENGEVIVRPRGDLDATSAPELERAIQGLLDSREVRKWTFDLGEVEYLDSSGLGMLVRTLKRLRERGVEMALARPQLAVQRVLALTRLDRIFQIHGDP